MYARACKQTMLHITDASWMSSSPVTLAHLTQVILFLFHFFLQYFQEHRKRTSCIFYTLKRTVQEKEKEKTYSTFFAFVIITLNASIIRPLIFES